MMVVDLSIGDDGILVLAPEVTERLFSLGREIIDGESMEADDAGGVEVKDGVIWSSGFDFFEALELGGG